eukprot:TRINITY_DN12910_c0_g1_i3.p1 TRINITY_DN12910_c0_g1~~TRINITY_DN12910_c0_g1_i3.p1  ORF type:complete len:272 (+),score=50.54 TRINITY_DN12910_c0_g1_i3:629-1444(+)
MQMLEAQKYWADLVQLHYGRLRSMGEDISMESNEGLFVLKRVTQEKRSVLLDEYETRYGESREAILEELKLERDILIKHLTIGEEFLTFFIFAGSGSGKTFLLRYIQWRVTCRMEEVFLDMSSDPSTDYYYEQDSAITNGITPPVPLLSLTVDANELNTLFMTSQRNSFINGATPMEHCEDEISCIVEACWLALQRETRNHSDEQKLSNYNKSNSHMKIEVSREGEKEADRVKSILHVLIRKSRLILLVDNLEYIPCQYDDGSVWDDGGDE